jgi:hypothetical protein
MIIFGSKATPIATETIKGKCAHCGTQDSVQMTVFQKYADLFWIPFFPIGKTAVTQCSHCKQVLEKKQFNIDLINSYERIKANSKTPVWTFSGLGLLVVLFFVGGIVSEQRNAKNTELIAHPQAGDLYEIKIDYKQYTLYKVESISGDSVYVLINDYETNKRRGLEELKQKGDEAFYTKPFSIHKDELKVMLEEGEVLDVERK